MKDPKTGFELAKYYLDDVVAEQRATHSAVIMCAIYRSPKAKGQWEVAAVGSLAQGQAGAYGPLLGAVAALPPLHKGWR